MEIQIRRKNKEGTSKFLVNKQKCLQNLETNHNSTLISTPDTSFFGNNQELQSIIISDQIKAKAEMLLNLPRTSRNSNHFKQPRKSQKQAKLSLMYTPKKKTTINEMTESYFRRRKANQSRIVQLNNIRRIDSQRLIQSINKNPLFNTKLQTEDKDFIIRQTQQKDQDVHPLNCSLHRRNKINFFSLPEYFLLVFSKILSKPGKQKIYTFIKQLSVRYQKYPETIMQDVLDMRRISSKLLLALGPKQNYVQLKPFEALQVDGQLSRLVFHMAHDITTRKYKNYDLIKVYKEIQYCSRRLQFHKFTLKMCFQIGQIYKQQFDELNSHAYYAKALKLAIFLNDKFHEQKAVDCFGIAAYNSNKAGQAYYFHENSSKLCILERDKIHQKYSNNDQIDKISREKSSERLKCPQITKSHFNKKKQVFIFNGSQINSDYQSMNRSQFKKNISAYIQCPSMRQNTIIAKNFMNRIDKIGKKEVRCHNWQNIRGTNKFNGGQQIVDTSQILITHRSLNRKNPEYEQRLVQREKKVLLQLINYYINQKLNVNVKI